MRDPVEDLRRGVRRIERLTGRRPNVLVVSPRLAGAVELLTGPTALEVPSERRVRARRWYRRRNKRWLRFWERVRAAIDGEGKGSA